MSNINLDDATMRGLVASVLTNNLSAEHRDKLFTKAIESLLEPPKDTNWNSSYRDKQSQLEKVFSDACYQVAQEYVREQFKTNEELRAKLHAVVDAAIKKTLFTDEASTIDKVAGGIADALSKVRNY